MIDNRSILERARRENESARYEIEYMHENGTVARIEAVGMDALAAGIADISNMSCHQYVIGVRKL